MPQNDPDTYIIKDLYERKPKIHPRQVNGIFAKFRIFSVIGLLGFFYLTPWLTWNSNQAILLDLPARKFHLFSITFWPQDFVYLTLLLVICAVGLFLFTAIAGRLWCGYTCPQTVWTETFLWIEELVEGNRNKRIKLDKQSWGVEKLTKKNIQAFSMDYFCSFYRLHVCRLFFSHKRIMARNNRVKFRKLGMVLDWTILASNLR